MNRTKNLTGYKYQLFSTFPLSCVHNRGLHFLMLKSKQNLTNLYTAFYMSRVYNGCFRNIKCYSVPFCIRLHYVTISLLFLKLKYLRDLITMPNTVTQSFLQSSSQLKWKFLPNIPTS